MILSLRQDISRRREVLKVKLSLRSDISKTAQPRPIPAEDVRFDLLNNTPYIVRRIFIQAQLTPGSVVNTYHPPTTNTMVMPNGGTTKIWTTAVVASVNWLYDVSFYFILPEDKDKVDAYTRISTIPNQQLGKIASMALSLDAEGRVEAVSYPK
jgi:hypothetical protein